MTGPGEREMSNQLVREIQINKSATDHLYGSLNVNFTIQSQGPDLIYDHVNHNERSCSSNSSRTMNNDGTSRG